MRCVGQARISRTGKSLLVRVNQSDTFTVRVYSIPLSGLRKVLEGEDHDVAVFRVRE